LEGIAWQVFVAPFLAGACYWIFIWFAAYGIYPFLRTTLGDELIVVTTMLIVVFVLLTAFVFYFPLYAFFGGFDEYSLNVYKKAVALTGPSIIITWPFYKLFTWGYRHSPFKKLAVIPFTAQADREVLELARLRLEGRTKASAKAS